MRCPKCEHLMESVNYGREYKVNRCSNCQGLWFPQDSYEQLKQEWMSQSLDTGDPKLGRKYNKIQNIKSPVTGKPMQTVTDRKQPHIHYEIDVDDNGAFFDAGEFTDYVEETLSDLFKGLMATARRLRK